MGTPIWKGTTALLAQVESGTLTLADRVSTVDVYRAPYSVCLANVLRRGTFGGSFRLGWVVTSSKLESERGGVGKLTISWEIGGASANTAYLPLDDFDSQVVELYPKIERNAFFAGITRDTLGLGYAAVYGATQAQRDAQYAKIVALTDPTQNALGLALVAKLLNGEETFYLAGMRFNYIFYAFVMPTLSLGGFRQVPGMATAMGLAGMGWLRLADFVQPAGVNGSVFKITQTWLGGPSGFWDPDLYP